MKRLSLTILGTFAFTAIFLFYVVPPQQNIENESPYTITTANKDKKKILIFSSRGGGGHISVMNAIEQYLEEDFCVGHSFIFTDVLGALDPAQRILNSKVNGEDWYNLTLKRKWHQMTNFTYSFGAWYYHFRQNSVKSILEKYLTEHKPDLIVSVIPLINHLILSVAQKMNIPFLLIPTDLDATIAMYGISKPQYDKFHLALSYQDPTIRESFKKADVDEKYISHVGFPVKKAFFDPHSQRSIKNEFGIPENKSVILLLMGAQGSNELYEFTRQLSKLQIPAHLIVVLGKSEYLRKSLSKISKPKHITTTFLGFTDRIPDLMAISDLVITKSGSVSVNEAIYSQLPLLLDGTSTVLSWEQFNHRFIKQNGLGNIIKRSYRIPYMVTQMLTNREYRDNIKHNLAMFDKKNPEHEIKLLVRQILAS